MLNAAILYIFSWIISLTEINVAYFRAGVYQIAPSFKYAYQNDATMPKMHINLIASVEIAMNTFEQGMLSILLSPGSTLFTLQAIITIMVKRNIQLHHLFP